MLKGRDIIVFADDWGRHPSTPQHLVRILMEQNRVLWVNSFGFRTPRFTLADVQRIGKKLALMTSPRPVESPVSAPAGLHPMVLPYYDSAIVRKVDNVLLRRQVTARARGLGFTDPIILAAHPLMADFLGTMGESSSHYLCLDDYPNLPNAYRCAAELERIVLGKVDAVFSVSRQLQKDRQPRSGESHFLPQGVDLDHFRSAGTSDEDPFAGLPRPIIGFHGLITAWVDVELMARCASAYPAMSFVVIGRRDVDVTPLASCPNVHLFDAVPYQELPRFLRRFDVGVIPFGINDLTVASNPLKLVEYLALGLPVLSTDLPEVRRFEPNVTIGKDHDSFVALLGAVASQRDDAARLSRRQCAEQYSWRAVTEGMCAVIERIEQAKRGSRPFTDGIPMKVLFVGMRYDYGSPSRGDCYEYRNLYQTLCRMKGIEVELFPYDVLLREHGREEMNRRLLETVQRTSPGLVFFVLFTDEIMRATVERISRATPTVNWFADDHWRFESFSRSWAPLFHYVSTTDRSAVGRYHAAGITKVILTQWAFNHFAAPPQRAAAPDLGVTFVGQVHSTRRALVNRLQREGLDVQAWGKGWPAGRLPQGDLASVFVRSAINLNFSESSVMLNVRSLAKIVLSRRADDSLHVVHPRAMMGYARHVIRRPRPQIKGRTFEVPGAGGFLLTGAADHLDAYLVPGREVAVFHDADELVERARFYLDHPDEREAIRRAGHDRVLREHTYEQRLLKIFEEMGVYANV